MVGGGGGGLGDHDPLSVGSYSQLLLSDDADDLHVENCFNFTPSFSSSEQNPPKMLCFGDDDQFNREECDLFFDEITTKIAQKAAGITCSDSSSASSTTTINTTRTVCTTTNGSSLTKSNKKKNPSGAGAVNNSEPVGNSGMAANGAPVGKQRNCKRTKSADDSTETTTGRHAKVKKEKLGERVIALQQLVSPFGKTDTASVLHEAMGYIRFLQDQVQVLCSPYLQRLPSSAQLLEEKGGEEGKESESRKDLRSKGLCLVPVELTAHVAETNGADFWSPSMVNKVS